MENNLIQVKCISNKRFKKELIIGKIYNVKQSSIHKDYYEIPIGKDISTFFKKNMFEIVNNIS